VGLVLAFQQSLTLLLDASGLQVQLPFQLQNYAFLGLQLPQLHKNKSTYKLTFPVSHCTVVSEGQD
jgi:hypothetical protein